MERWKQIVYTVSSSSSSLFDSGSETEQSNHGKKNSNHGYNSKDNGWESLSLIRQQWDVCESVSMKRTVFRELLLVSESGYVY